MTGDSPVVVAARLRRMRSMSMTRRPEGVVVPASRSISTVGALKPAACSRPSRSATEYSSRLNSPASAGLSCGLLASACSTTSSSAGGTAATSSRGGRGTSAECLSASESGVVPVKGVCPVSSS